MMVVVADGAAKALQHFFLLGGEVYWDFDLDAAIEIADAVVVQRAHAFAAQAQDFVGLGALGYAQLDFAAESRYFDFVAERGLHHRDAQVANQVVVLALEDRVLFDFDDDVQIAARRALAFAFQTDAVAVVDSGWYFHR